MTGLFWARIPFVLLFLLVAASLVYWSLIRNR
jgi:hypothetical protein